MLGYLLQSYVVYLLAAFVTGTGVLAAQDFTPPVSSSSRPFAPSEPLPNGPECSRVQIATAPTLSFQQRVCFFSDRLLTPAGAVRGIFQSGFSQWRNVPFDRHEDLDAISRRFGVFYARRTAQGAGELLAGYLNHEDPRPRFSTQNGFWARTRSALLSVVVVEGSGRPALAPLAGAFGSGFTGMACYPTRNSLADGFRRTGLAYGGYFGTALAHEFHPDIQSFAKRLLRKKTRD